MDYQKHLARQLTFLAHSCQLYDQGARDEAIRIATVARVLFHHTHHPKTSSRGSRSLLHQLGATDMHLLSTCPRNPGGGWLPGFELNLAVITISPPQGDLNRGPTVEMTPKLGNHVDPEDARLLPFADWWDGEIVCDFISGGQPVRLSRKDIVCIAANQDGGAHVDPQLDREYQALERGAELIITDPREPNPIPLRNAHLATLRQIGYEILNSPELTALL
jgi:hypothetical protein